MAIFLWIFHIALVVAVSFAFFKKQTALKKYFWPALAARTIAGVCLGLLYTHYYAVADTFDYFRDAGKMATLARADLPSYLELLFFNRNLDILPLALGQPRAVFLTKIASVFHLITYGNYWLTGMYFSLISFSGAWVLVQAISRNIPSVTPAAVIAFLFLPSAAFWTSGLLKESLAMAALFYLTAFFLKIWFREKQSFRACMIALVSLWVLWNLKYYYAGIFLPVACSCLLYKFLFGKKFRSTPALETLVWIALFILPLMVISFWHPNFYPDRLLKVVVLNNSVFNELSAPGDYVHFDNLRATPVSMLQNAPQALFSGLFRPLIWEATSAIQLLQGVENTVLLLLFLAACLRFKKYLTSPHRLLLLGLLVYVVLLCVLITLSAPNFGTLSRYRVGYVSFFAFIIFCNNPVVQYLERSFRRLVSH